MRNSFINTILKEADKRDNIFIVTGDAGFGVLDEYKTKYPERFLNLGIAEQNAISFAAGLSLAGFKVYIYNIIPFLLYRCYEQVRNDICYQNLPITLIGTGSGLTYSPQGMTHYAVEDIGIAYTLPNLTVLSPSDPLESIKSAEYSLQSTEPIYVRVAKSGEPILSLNTNFTINEPRVLSDGETISIICYGNIAIETIKAIEILKTKNIYPLVLSVPMLKPFPFEKLIELLKKIQLVISVEEHFMHCGIGAILSTIRAKYKQAWDLINLGLPLNFVNDIKHLHTMRKHFGIDAESIVETILKKLEDLLNYEKVSIM